MECGVRIGFKFAKKQASGHKSSHVKALALDGFSGHYRR